MRTQREKQTQVLPWHRARLVKQMWSGDAFGCAFDRVASTREGCKPGGLGKEIDLKRAL